MKAAQHTRVDTPTAGISDYTDQWIRNATTLSRLAKQNLVAYSLWNSSSNQFIFFNDDHHVLGENDPHSFTNHEGVRYFLSRIHPGCIKAVYLMYEECIKYCKLYSENVQDNLFQFDVSFQKSKTENIQLLWQAQVVESDMIGHPLLFLNSICDITYLKKENTASLIIASVNETILWNFCFDKRKLERVKGFSSQEKRVLHYLDQKKGSKEIAALLNTSPHTIDTQRRSLLHKTNCVDCTALITYSRMTGLLL